MRISRKLSACLLPVLALAALATSVSSASAVEPWWHVGTSSRPTHLWGAKPEVQEVSSGGLTVLEVGGKFVACVGEFGVACPEVVGHPYTASASEFQASLEG